MSSERAQTAFVWAWLPGADEPVPAGRIWARGQLVWFNYGQSYLARPNAISLYEPELSLERGPIRPAPGLHVAGCINDAAPDAWGQRVVIRKLVGDPDRHDPSELGIIDYLLASGSDRIGALDFQESPDVYVARSETAPLTEMIRAADRLEAGEPFTAALDEALLHGSSIGGARPKVLLVDDDGRRLIAKLSSSRDAYPVVKAEALAMNLARRVGLDVAGTEIIECLDHDVLLVERFDRTPGTAARRMVISALTILELDEMNARYATYPGLADAIRSRFAEPKAALRELFARITFNICVGNTDDHARNHAAFWDGTELTLTPAYDVCPQARAGGEQAQAMAISRDGFRFSQLAGCVEAAGVYLLSEREATEIIDHQLHVIETEWSDAAEESRLTTADRQQFWGRQILNPYALEGYTRIKMQ